MNRIYLAFPEWGFKKTYLCVSYDLVVEHFVGDISALTIPKFIAWRSHKQFDQDMPLKDIPTFPYTSYTGPRFATDARGRIWEGATVTNLALQLAYHMGIERAILIGVDHNFTSKVKRIRRLFLKAMIRIISCQTILAKASNGSCRILIHPRSDIFLRVKPIAKQAAKLWMQPSVAN
jgi:hypothetical protein